MSLQTLINNDEGNDDPGDDTAPDEDTDLDLYSQHLGAQSLLLKCIKMWFLATKVYFLTLLTMMTILITNVWTKLK